MSSRIPALILLLTMFVLGFANVVTTGRLSVPQPWNMTEKLLLVSLIYWWYHTDKALHAYRAGPLLNVGVVVLFIVAIPVYLFRSREMRQGIKALFVFLVFGAAAIAALVAGGAVGNAIAP
jgi:hypothetical protein